MELLKTVNVQIGDMTFPCRMSNRATMELDAMSSISDSSLEKLNMLFYCTAKAGAKKEGKEFKYTYDEFLDEIDDYPSEVITNFTSALVEMNDSKKKLSPQENP